MKQRWPALLVMCAALAGCGVLAPPDDAEVIDAAATSDDGETLDAALDGPIDSALDALLDAPMERALDAQDASPDAAPPPCMVAGTPGECIDVARCLSPRQSTPGLCPGPTNIQCCAATTSSGWCPAVMSTPNARLTEEPGEGGCPAGMLRVETFCVDRFEASLVEVRADGTLASWSPFYNPGSRRMRAVSLRGAMPQGYINGVQAGAACREAGKRLCADAEWLRACRGAASRIYPYGNTRMPGVCNDARTPHPAIECFHSSEAWIWSNIGYAGINQQADTVARSGSHAGCVTGEGAFDMMGNLHEWTADPAGTFRGGFYVDTVMNGNGCQYATTAHDTTHWDYSTGFRCCAGP